MSCRTLCSLVAVLMMSLPASWARSEGDVPLPLVQRVLEVRAAAVRSGDRAGFLATVDPEAPAAFREAQGRQFDGLRSLGLADYRLQARVDDTGDLGHAVSARYSGDLLFLPETRQRLRLAGIDERDAVDTLWLTFVRRGQRWYVASDSDLEQLGLETGRGLWDFGPVVIAGRPGTPVLTHPGQEPRAEALSDLAETAARRLATRWPEARAGHLPLVVPASIDELERILQLTSDATKFVAFVGYGAVRDHGFETTAPRLYAQDQNLSRYGRSGQVEILVHELGHAAAAPFSGPHVPAWVHEGVSEWLARGSASNRRIEGSLPRDFEFTTGSQAAIVQAYAEAHAAISALADRMGQSGPRQLLGELGAAKATPGSLDFNVDAVLRRLARMSLGDLEEVLRFG